MKMKRIFIILFSITFPAAYGQHEKFLGQQVITAGDSIGLIQINADSIYNSNQVISLLILPIKNTERFGIDISYSESELRTTSSMAKKKNAIAAIIKVILPKYRGGIFY